MSKLIYIPEQCDQIWFNRPSICYGDSTENTPGGSFIYAETLSPIKNGGNKTIFMAAVDSENSVLVYSPLSSYSFGDPDSELKIQDVKGFQSTLKLHDAILAILNFGLAEGKYGGKEHGSLLEAIERLCLLKDDVLILKNDKREVAKIVTRCDDSHE